MRHLRRIRRYVDWIVVRHFDQENVGLRMRFRATLLMGLAGLCACGAIHVSAAQDANSVDAPTAANEVAPPPVIVEPQPTSSNATPDGLPACATQPDVLGVARVIEVDAKGGTELGGSHGGRIDFLGPKEVVLTFDDGPMRSYTRQVLKALADECTLGTFFMVGRMAAADPEMVKEVAAAGHTIGSHTWSHKNLGANAMPAVKREVEMGISAINRAYGKPSAPFFRFPYLSDNKNSRAYVKSRDYAAFWIDVDSKDYLTRDPQAMHRRVMAGLAATGKGIILFHDIQPSTVRGLKGLLADMRAKGYKVVHVVAGSDGTSVAEYDALAEKVFSARAKSAADAPLKDRALVSTMASGDGLDDVEAPSTQSRDRTRRKPAKPVAQKPKKPASDGPEVLPWQLNTYTN